MSVWFAIPSARPPAEANKVLKVWRAQGYKIALRCSSFREADAKIKDMHISTVPYQGWAHSINMLSQALLIDSQVEWIVTGGDDTYPDPNHSAEEIAQQCREHFSGTLGVMQPTGDRWGDHNGAYIDRICGSPFIGREFCRRAYLGRGPLCAQYTHMFADEELQLVAKSGGMLWQRPDLTHYHDHWGRPKEGESMAPSERMPKFLEWANSEEHWHEFRGLFERRKAAGFPGSGLL